MKDDDARNLLCFLYSSDRQTFFVFVRITTGRNDDSCSESRIPLHVELGKRAVNTRIEKFEYVRLHEPHVNLGFGTSKPGVKLQDLRPLGGHFEPRIEHADERASFLSEGSKCGLHYPRINIREFFFRDPRNGRSSTHAARHFSCIVLSYRLVILRRWEYDRRFPIRDCVNGYLLPIKEFFDNDFA